MSLQTRLAALITAVGADIKALQTAINQPAPMALVWKSANQAAIAANGNAVLTFDQELRDSGGFHATNASSFIAPADGTYIIGAQVAIAAPTTGGHVDCYIRVTRATGGATDFLGRDGIGVGDTGCSPSVVAYLFAGDTVEVILYNSSGAPITPYGGGGSLSNGPCNFHIAAVRGAKGDRGDAGQRQAIPWVAVLPSAPQDGDEVLFVADVANAVVWHLRYNATIVDAYKWVCIGGQPVQKTIQTDEKIVAASAWLDLTTPGPSYNVPLAGIYDVEWGARVYTVPLQGSNNALIGLQAAGGNPATADRAAEAYTPAGSTQFNISPTRATRVPGLAAGDLLKLVYQITVAGQCGFLGRVLRVTPVRVG